MTTDKTKGNPIEETGPSPGQEAFERDLTEDQLYVRSDEPEDSAAEDPENTFVDPDDWTIVYTCPRTGVGLMGVRTQVLRVSVEPYQAEVVDWPQPDHIAIKVDDCPSCHKPHEFLLRDLT